MSSQTPPKPVKARAPEDLDDSHLAPEEPLGVSIGRTVSGGAGAHSLAGSYRWPGSYTMGPRGAVVPHSMDQAGLTREERRQGREDERELLADNNVLLDSSSSRTIGRNVGKKISGLLSQALHTSDSTARESDDDEVSESPILESQLPSETTALLGDVSHGPNGPGSSDGDSGYEIDQKWEEAVAAGLIHTTWGREAKVLTKYTAPLMVTFLLQYSLTVASIFTVGHLGKVELGAVSLASMTANISGYAIYQGLATSLDTLCAQAYGSGRKHLVGLQMQRMVYFLWILTIPIGFVWFFADRILTALVPEPEVAALAGQYLKVVLLGAPGIACFEAGKRFVQAQGLFSASLFVLLICAPLNAFLNWLFVWVSFNRLESFKSNLNISANIYYTALRMGICWRTSCSCDNRQLPPPPTIHLRLLLRRPRMLEWIHPPGLLKLGPNGPSSAPWLPNG